MAGDEHPDGAVGGGRTLADRLAAAGVSDSAEPWDAWLQLRAAEGNRTTLIDLYELVAAPQGLAAHELPAATRLSLAQQAMAQTWPGFAVTEGSERPRMPLVDHAARNERKLVLAGGAMLLAHHLGHAELAGSASPSL